MNDPCFQEAYSLWHRGGEVGGKSSLTCQSGYKSANRTGSAVASILCWESEVQGLGWVENWLGKMIWIMSLSCCGFSFFMFKTRLMMLIMSTYSGTCQ